TRRSSDLKQRKRYSRCSWPIRAAHHSFEHEISHRIANNTPNGFAKHQTETEHHPYHRYHRHTDKTLEHRGYHVLFLHHATIEKRESRRHNQYECRGRKHPRNIRSVEFRLTRNGQCRKEKCQ